MTMMHVYYILSQLLLLVFLTGYAAASAVLATHPGIHRWAGTLPLVFHVSFTHATLQNTPALAFTQFQHCSVSECLVDVYNNSISQWFLIISTTFGIVHRQGNIKLDFTICSMDVPSIVLLITFDSTAVQRSGSVINKALIPALHD